MSSRTARWVSQTHPGARPPPPSRVSTAAPPPTIYPESSVSNPDASRYTGRSSHSRSTPQYHTSTSSHHSSHHSSRVPPRSSHSHSRSMSTVPVQTYHSGSHQPIIARTSDRDGRTDSYMIIPPKGQHVEILHPTSAAAAPSHYYSYSSSASRSPQRPKDKPLLKRLFGKVDWGDDNRSSSSRTVHSSYSSGRSRRNSTGSAQYTVLSPGSRSGGTRVQTIQSTRPYDIIYV